MAIIYSYPYDQIVTDTDAWVGTDSINRQTKQYTAKAVADYLNINGRIAIAGQMNYQFVEDPSFKAGTFAFSGGQGDNVSRCSRQRFIWALYNERLRANWCN